MHDAGVGRPGSELIDERARHRRAAADLPPKAALAMPLAAWAVLGLFWEAF